MSCVHEYVTDDVCVHECVIHGAVCVNGCVIDGMCGHLCVMCQ